MNLDCRSSNFKRKNRIGLRKATEITHSLIFFSWIAQCVQTWLLFEATTKNLNHKIQTYLHHVVVSTICYEILECYGKSFCFCPCFFFWGCLCTVSYPQSRIMYVREFNACPGIGHKWLINSFRKKNLETTHKKNLQNQDMHAKMQPSWVSGRIDVHALTSPHLVPT